MTLDSLNAFTVTVTPQSVLWKYTWKFAQNDNTVSCINTLFSHNIIPSKLDMPVCQYNCAPMLKNKVDGNFDSSE